MARSWFPIPLESHFSLANIPFGIISSEQTKEPRPAVAIGDHAFCLLPFAQGGGFSDLKRFRSHVDTLNSSTLNAFAALGRPVTGEVRNYLQRVFADDTEHPRLLKNNKELQNKCLIPLKEVTCHVPFQIGDYTDFYAGKNHAYNIGVMFRGPQNALQPNYTHLPVGYHGRASSVVVSGTSVIRPSGQILENPSAEVKKPIFSQSRRLDIELELGAFMGTGNEMGQPIPIEDAYNHIFGYVLLNDWSARDIQAWEYVPLGPFNAKNFATTISAWVVHVDALEPFRCKGLPNPNDLLPYLQEKEEKTLIDIKLEVDITTPLGNTTTITSTNASNLLFSFPQMVAHHSVGGCPMKAGDLLGSGTISGVEAGSQGSMIEISQGGKNKIKLQGGEERTFLEDGDTVNIRGWSRSANAGIVGFGNCVGTIAATQKR